MRQFINTITDSIITLFGVKPNGTVVAGMVEHGLRAASFARTLLVPLTGLAPVGLQMAPARHLRSVDPGAAAAERLEHYRSSWMWPRLCLRPVISGLRGRVARS